MNNFHGQGVLPDELLAQIHGGGGYPYRPQVGPAYDYSVNPRALFAAMGAGAVTGGLGGAAVGGIGAGPGALGGSLLAGIGYTGERLLNPTLVRPAVPFAVCHGPGYAPNTSALKLCH